MAIAVNGGHISRAINFYDAAGKYIIIGNTQAWEDESVPTPPTVSDFKLKNVVALKKVDNTYLVVPDDVNGTISYRSQKWRRVSKEVNTTISSSGVTNGSVAISVNSVAGFSEGSKVRVNNLYDATIVSISNNILTLDTPAPSSIPAGSPVLGGARVEGAKYVYVECYLEYNTFPLVTYRQIGLCTGVTPNNSDILRSAEYSPTNANEYESLGVLEILDNRVPLTRDINQRELISMIIEF